MIFHQDDPAPGIHGLQHDPLHPNTATRPGGIMDATDATDATDHENQEPRDLMGAPGESGSCYALDDQARSSGLRRLRRLRPCVLLHPSELFQL